MSFFSLSSQHKSTNDGADRRPVVVDELGCTACKIDQKALYCTDIIRPLVLCSSTGYMYPVSAPATLTSGPTTHPSTAAESTAIPLTNTTKPSLLEGTSAQQLSLYPDVRTLSPLELRPVRTRGPGYYLWALLGSALSVLGQNMSGVTAYRAFRKSEASSADGKMLVAVFISVWERCKWVRTASFVPCGFLILFCAIAPYIHKHFYAEYWHASAAIFF